MAEITKRIILFIISLILICIYLVSAAPSNAKTPESFSLLSPKQMIKQEIANVPENNIIFNEAQEYPLRSFTFEPIIYFNDLDEIWICGEKEEKGLLVEVVEVFIDGKQKDSKSLGPGHFVSAMEASGQNIYLTGRRRTNNTINNSTEMEVLLKILRISMMKQIVDRVRQPQVGLRISKIRKER